ncbi:MAG TPA: ABC transporter permease [Vicinamibacteria bacterium]|nr:ABC transporter permease [Vicinamibacteria bacterium]
MKEDLVYALRQLVRHRGHAAVVVLIFSLGFGVNAAVFSIVDAVLLRALPVKDPSSLVLFQWTAGPSLTVGYLTGEWWRETATGQVRASSFSHPAFEAFRGRTRTLEAVFAWAELRRASLAMDGQSELVSGQLVSGGYYSGLGVPAFLGRTITEQDDRAGAEVVAVISHGYWQRRFGASPDAIGRMGTLDGRPVTVVGVSPRRFSGTLPVGRSADVSVPLLAWRASEAPYVSDPAWYWLQVMGRRRPGVTLAQVEAEMAPRLASGGAARAGEEPQLRLADGSRGLARRRHEHRAALVVLAAVTGLVLLMACAAVAGLLLARGAARQREIAVRLALGAGRRRIVRQLLAESAVLTALAAVAGLAIASWAKDALATGLMPDGAPAVALDHRVLALLGATSAASAILSGLVPALRATRVDLTRDLRDGAGAGLRRGRGGSVVVVQVALSLVLLVGAGLFLRTLRNLTSVDTGLAADGLYLFEVHAVDAGPDVSRRLLERFRASPVVQAVGVSGHQPLGGRADHTRLTIEGRPAPAGDEFVHVNRVGGDFFTALGIPVRAGRALGPQDDLAAPPAMVVNEAFARAYFPGQDPLGRRVNGAEVVGVAADTLYGALREPAPATMFVPAFQHGQGSFCFQVRTPAPLGTLEPALRKAVRDVDPTAALHGLTTPRQQLQERVSQERLLAALTSFFGALTLLVASLGLYSLMAYSTGRRMREMGVRSALGARPGDIRRLALGLGLRLVVTGAGLGLAGVLALHGVTTSLLYGVAPWDPAAVGAAVLLGASATLLACWIPAARAARVDPAVALRCE